MFVPTMSKWEGLEINLSKEIQSAPQNCERHLVRTSFDCIQKQGISTDFFLLPGGRRVVCLHRGTQSGNVGCLQASS